MTGRKTPEEIAREIVAAGSVDCDIAESGVCEVGGHVDHMIYACGGCLTSGIAAAIRSAVSAERAACAEIADRCWRERSNALGDCKKAGGAVEALAGKASEAHRIAAAIRARKKEA